MKEKRILAMFITSAITLVASLAVTFGVMMTLADPVVATGIVRYSYNFNANNDRSLIYEDGSSLSLKEEIVFNPSKSLEWDDPSKIISFGKTIKDDITYMDESISSRIRVIPIKLNNNYEQEISIDVKVNYNRDRTIGKYTFVKVYNFADGTYTNYDTSYPITLEAHQTAELAIVVYVDLSQNVTGFYELGTADAVEAINVEAINKTTIL